MKRAPFPPLLSSIIAVAASAAWVAAASLSASCASPNSAMGSSSDLSQIERDAEAGVNVYRKASDRSILESDENVAEIARRHSKNMAKGKVGFGHDGLEGRVQKVQERLEISGAAENIAKQKRKHDHAEVAVRMWLESPRHLENINGDYDLSGVGAARSADGTIYITQIFVKLR